MEIRASEYGIMPGEHIGKSLNEMFRAMANIEGEKTIVFEPGDYYIDSEDAVYTHELRITNTIGEREWRKGEDIQGKRIAMYIESVKDMTLEGNGARFILDGVMTNMALLSCERVAIKNITIDVVRPNVHKMTITDVKPFYFDFVLDKDSRYEKRGSRYYFVGKDYEYDFLDKAKCSWWIGYLREDSKDIIERSMHPLMSAWRIKELGEGVFRAYSFLHSNIKKGNTYHLYDVRRKDVGIFIDSSRDIVLEGVTQHFNYSLGIVGQNSENITIDSVRMAPSDDTELEMVSVADFIHLCMCRGDIKIRKGYFLGAGDDCLNVHGIHYQIVNIDGNKIVVRFMHPQAYGFNPLRSGDIIEYVDRKTLLKKGSAKILSSRMLNEYDIELTLDSTAYADTRYCIEDISACPNLEFTDNYMSRIITRGILVTTRGKVLIENNNFDSCSMHSILFSDDANSWYESGRVLDATIRGNTFRYTPMYNIYIKPENSVHEDYVHGDILIEGNTFKGTRKGGIYAKSTRSVTIRDNVVEHGTLRVDTENVGTVNRD